MSKDIQNKNTHLTKKDRMEILFLYNVYDMNPFQIHKKTGRARPTVQKVLDNYQHEWDETVISERLNERILEHWEKNILDMNDTLEKINRTMNNKVNEIVEKKYLTPGDMKLLLDIARYTQTQQLKAQENTYKIEHDKQTLKLKEKELDNKFDDTKEFLEGFGSLINNLKGDNNESIED